MHYSSIFEEVNPLENPYCRRWLHDKDRFCRLLAGRKDERPRAEQIRIKVLTLPLTDPRLHDHLLELAEMVHCRNHHRTTSQIQGTAQRWRAELQQRSPRYSPRDDRSHDQHARAQARVRAASSPRAAESPTPHSTRPVIRQLQPHRNSERGIQLTQTPMFQPMKSAMRGCATTEELIVDTVLQSLTSHQSRPGQIYIFTRSQSPRFIKIGYSHNNVARRLIQWSTQCGYEPILLYRSEPVPNVYHVERLIFAELAAHRRYDMRCVNDSDSLCGQSHREWFDVDVRTAKEVATRWIRWMQEGDPYYYYSSSSSSRSGTLKRSWVAYAVKWLARASAGDVPPFGAVLPDPAARTARPTEEVECSICYDTISCEDQQLHSCPQCRNSRWHDGCIEEWLQQAPSCPFCRGRWLLPREDGPRVKTEDEDESESD